MDLKNPKGILSVISCGALNTGAEIFINYIDEIVKTYNSTTNCQIKSLNLIPTGFLEDHVNNKDSI